MKCIIGVDPGISNFGIAVVSMDRELLSTDVFRSKPSTLKIRKSEDNAKRVRDLYVWLDHWFEANTPVCCCAESFSFVRNASSSAKIGMAWGVLMAACVEYEVPLAQASPQAIKQAVCGRKNASKKEVIEAVEHLYDFDTDDWPKPRGIVEHAADAAGAVWTLWDEDIVMAARK